VSERQFQFRAQFEFRVEFRGKFTEFFDRSRIPEETRLTNIPSRVAISVVAQLKTETGVGYGSAEPSAPRTAPWSMHGTHLRRLWTAGTRPLAHS
jgi:hypothetical protein